MSLVKVYTILYICVTTTTDFTDPCFDLLCVNGAHFCYSIGITQKEQKKVDNEIDQARETLCVWEDRKKWNAEAESEGDEKNVKKIELDSTQKEWKWNKHYNSFIDNQQLKNKLSASTKYIKRCRTKLRREGKWSKKTTERM